jgi:bis(5'-nucleosyl)-tetraphosphatase (symmetrical)
MLYGVREHRHTDTMTKILEAPDALELGSWLRAKPLIHIDNERRFIVCHAGIYPWWSLKKASRRAAKVEKIFHNEDHCISLLKKIYSNYPSQWKSGLSKTQKHRFTINTFTRMRFVSDKGHLNFTESGYSERVRKNRLPWFTVPNPSLTGYRTVFGHWSALGLLNTPKLLALDTGCVWGKHLTLAKIPKNPNKKAKLFIAPNHR